MNVKIVYDMFKMITSVSTVKAIKWKIIKVQSSNYMYDI